MKQTFLKFHWNIVTKFIMVCVLILVFVGGIVAANLLSLRHIERLLLTIIDRDVAQITENARLGRELSQVFADTNLLISTSTDNPEYLNTEGKRLLEVLSRNLSSSLIKNEDALQGALQNFMEDLQTLLDQSGLVNETSQTLESLNQGFQETLTTFENTLAEEMITIMADGKKEESFAVEQLSTMIPGYRDTFSQITILFTKARQEHIAEGEGEEDEEHEQHFIALLEELTASLTVVATAGEKFGPFGKQLTDILIQYQGSLAVFHQVTTEFQTQLAHLKTAQEQVLAEMGKVDAQVVQTTEHIKAEAAGAIQSSRNLIIFLSMVILVVLIAVGFYAFRLIRPIRDLATTAAQMAEGDITCEIPVVTSRDEIGTLSQAFEELMSYIQDMASVATEIAQGNLSGDIQPRSNRDVLGQAFQDMSSYLNEMATVATTIAAGDLRQEVQPKTEHDVLGKAFQRLKSLRSTVKDIMQGAERLSDASALLHQISTDIASGAEQSSQQVRFVSSNSQQISQNISGVSTASEEFAASTQEIARNIAEVVNVIQAAVKVTKSAHNTMTDLQAQSAEIGEISHVIATITQQTNLLALNATIEAARAGDFGKGFAVVAGEVKELARETAGSAEDISTNIEAIQTGIREATEATTHVSEGIQQVQNLSQAISAAVEEQAATMTEISHNLADTAHGSEEISRSITEVASATQQASEQIVTVQEAAQELDLLAGKLRQLVKKFTI